MVENLVNKLVWWWVEWMVDRWAWWVSLWVVLKAVQSVEMLDRT